MKEKYFYSASTNSFYPFSLFEDYRSAGSLPDDLKEVSGEVFNEFASQKEGFVRHHKNGLPIWIEAPPSDLHEYKNGKWVISKDNEEKLKEREREAERARIQEERAKLMQEMQYQMLLGNQEEARSIAFQIQELDLKLKP